MALASPSRPQRHEKGRLNDLSPNTHHITAQVVSANTELIGPKKIMKRPMSRAAESFGGSRKAM